MVRYGVASFIPASFQEREVYAFSGKTVINFFDVSTVRLVWRTDRLPDRPGRGVRDLLFLQGTALFLPGKKDILFGSGKPTGYTLTLFVIPGLFVQYPLQSLFPVYISFSLTKHLGRRIERYLSQLYTTLKGLFSLFAGLYLAGGLFIPVAGRCIYR